MELKPMRTRVDLDLTTITVRADKDLTKLILELTTKATMTVKLELSLGKVVEAPVVREINTVLTANPTLEIARIMASIVSLLEIVMKALVKTSDLVYRGSITMNSVTMVMPEAPDLIGLLNDTTKDG